jgi:SAM-dependent methyltransferase
MSARFGEPLAAGTADSPAAERNKQPILEVLTRVLPPRGTVLEVASGTGQHAVHFARALPALTWQPTDPDLTPRVGLAARVSAAALPNLRAPEPFDVLADAAPVVEPAAVVCINMIHIAPWPATDGLFRHAARLLPAGAPLILYGPYKLDGHHTAPSNEAFDASLRARDPRWGVRDLGDVRAVGVTHGFDFRELVPMPANNFVVIFVRGADVK